MGPCDVAHASKSVRGSSSVVAEGDEASRLCMRSGPCVVLFPAVLSPHLCFLGGGVMADRRDPGQVWRAWATQYVPRYHCESDTEMMLFLDTILEKLPRHPTNGGVDSSYAKEKGKEEFGG